MPREREEIGANPCKGLLALVRNRVADGSFGARYPDICPDGTDVSGTDLVAFDDALRAEIPGLAEIPDRNNSGYLQSTLDELRRSEKQPSTLDMFDLIEFCWKGIGKPTKISHHSYFSHHHLKFDIESGRAEFCDQVETIFRRNGIAYALTEEGRIQRLVAKDFESAVVRSEYDTGDAELDRLLGTARRKFLDPDLASRREALEALWDAWERLKTLDGRGDKKAKAMAMLDKIAGTSSSRFRDALDREAAELTAIGNNLRIRHSETTQEIISTSEHVDYLYYRLHSLIHLILQSR